MEGFIFYLLYTQLRSQGRAIMVYCALSLKAVYIHVLVICTNGDICQG